MSVLLAGENWLDCYTGTNKNLSVLVKAILSEYDSHCDAWEIPGSVNAYAKYWVAVEMLNVFTGTVMPCNPLFDIVATVIYVEKWEKTCRISQINHMTA